MGYGVTKILKEGKLFQTNIFLVKNTKYIAIQPIYMWYGVIKILQEGKTVQTNLLFSLEHLIQGY